MKTVTIHNKGPGIFSANLVHEVYCARSGKCHCTVTNRVVLKIDPDTGAKSKGMKPRRVNGAIHIPVGQKMEGLHPFIKAVPEVKTALAAGRITIEEQVQDAPEKKPGKQAPKTEAAKAAPDTAKAGAEEGADTGDKDTASGSSAKKTSKKGDQGGK